MEETFRDSSLKIRMEENTPYLKGGRDFIDDDKIWSQINGAPEPERKRVEEILEKSLSLQRLDPTETATLIKVTDPDLFGEMKRTALKVKEKVYGHRIVTFAPLYVSNLCVNNCVYCGYRRENDSIDRHTLTDEELVREIEALVEKGHKRLVMVYGEHPSSDVRYIAHTIEKAYSVKRPPSGEIRRANVNAAPLGVEDYRLLKKVGIGTYQIFQETYHHETYSKVHPKGTLKGNYQWRLYGLHRAQEAGVDDVAPGVLFGLYDWRFEVMGLLYHTIDLEEHFGGVGPHTLSFPRLEPAITTPFVSQSPYLVSDDQFERVITVLRLSVPYTGMILTARESPKVRERMLSLGITQLDFGSNIGVGSYSPNVRDPRKEQFTLGDNRTLDEGIRWLADQGFITSFCTADYRCGRTGNCFMRIAKKGNIHSLCIPNAFSTFSEYLRDYGSPETRRSGEALMAQALQGMDKESRSLIDGMLERIEKGERDVYI